MLAIAVFGIALWAVVGTIGERRRDYFRSRVETFAWGEADIIERVASELRAAREHEARGPQGRAEAESARLRAEQLAELAAWHVKMERRYAWAAEHPFTALPPDPQPPSWTGEMTLTDPGAWTGQ